jgi:hypothetical protein
LTPFSGFVHHFVHHFLYFHVIEGRCPARTPSSRVSGRRVPLFLAALQGQRDARVVEIEGAG